MSDPQKTVFISYRRSTSKHLARSIFMDLRANGYDVFLDVNTIDSGAFDTIILNQIAARAHFIVLLSPGALERCQNEGDWLRREIEEAIRLQRNVVPIIEEGVDFENEVKFLPLAARTELSRMNGPRLFHDYFDAAMDALRNRFLKQPVYGTVVATQTDEHAEVERRIEQAAAYSQEKTIAREYIIRGDEKYGHKDYDGAIADYTKAIQLDPEFALAYFNRGYIRHNIKQDIAAVLPDYTKAIRFDPNFALAYLYRGIARKSKRNKEGAMADYNDAIRLDPTNAYAYLERGILYEEKSVYSEIEDAITDYQKYLDLGGGIRHGNQTAIESKIAELTKKLDGRRTIWFKKDKP